MDADKSNRSALVAGLLLTVMAPAMVATACGASSNPGPATPVASASASSSAALFTQGATGATPISIEAKVGGCDVTVHEGLGATYLFDAAAMDQAKTAILGAMEPCLSPGKGTQGTVYVRATVGADGQLTAPVVSPGGAVSTDVVQCLMGTFGKARLVAPKEKDSVLMLFVVSACAPP